MKQVQIGCQLFGVGTKYIYICRNPGRSGETCYFHPSFSKWTKIDFIKFVLTGKYFCNETKKTYGKYILYLFSKKKQIKKFEISQKHGCISMNEIISMFKKFNIEAHEWWFDRVQKLERKRKT